MHEYEPEYVLDLLVGLMGVDGSQYAAYRLEHDERPPVGKTSERLSWRGFSQDSSILLGILNNLEMIHANLLQMGGVKAKPVLLKGPGSVDADDRRHVKVDAAKMTPGQITNKLRDMWQGHGLA